MVLEQQSHDPVDRNSEDLAPVAHSSYMISHLRCAFFWPGLDTRAN